MRAWSFINQRHGRDVTSPSDEHLRPDNRQIMRIAQDLAGYSLGQADLLRRAMGKKKVSEMQKHRGIFVQGAGERGVDEKVADELFDQMDHFAEYFFNKSQSTA